MEPPRKRLKRNTRSCFQCRTRKVKCSLLTNHDAALCAECLKTGAQCTRQAPLDDLQSSHHDTAVHQDHSARLERVEALLQRLVEAQETLRQQTTQLPPEPEPDLGTIVPSDLWDDFVVQCHQAPAAATPGDDDQHAVKVVNPPPPLAGDSFSFSFSPSSSSPHPRQQQHTTTSAAAPPLPSSNRDGDVDGGGDDPTKQALISLLPSPQDALTIVTHTTAWLWGAETPQGSVLRADDPSRLLGEVGVEDPSSSSEAVFREREEKQSRSTVHVAKTLLLFALYMQQLPVGFDGGVDGEGGGGGGSLGLELQQSGGGGAADSSSSSRGKIASAVQLIVDRVRLFLFMSSPHDEACSELGGVECLCLLATLQMNEGELRDAWTTFRRLLDFCRLQGLDKSYRTYRPPACPRRSGEDEDKETEGRCENNKESDEEDEDGEDDDDNDDDGDDNNNDKINEEEDESLALKRRLWLSAVCGDCYCSLLLGLEPSLGIQPFGPHASSLDTWAETTREKSFFTISPSDDAHVPLVDADVQRRICLVVARIAQRNATGDVMSRASCRELDKALTCLQKTLPSRWFRTVAWSRLYRDRAPDPSSADPTRFICQQWLLQAWIFAEMPLAFGRNNDNDEHDGGTATTGLEQRRRRRRGTGRLPVAERGQTGRGAAAAHGRENWKQTYSLGVCMEQARLALTFHQGLGEGSRACLSRCRTADQAAFVAAVVMCLCKAQYRWLEVWGDHRVKDKARRARALAARGFDSDLALLAQARDSFAARGEHVASQIAAILAAMLGALDSPEWQENILSPDAADDGRLRSRVEGGMEDILVSSILPLLSPGGAPAHLVYLTINNKGRPARRLGQGRNWVTSPEVLFGDGELEDPFV